MSAVWPINERAARPPEDWKEWPKGKQFALIINHDVDTKRGFDRCRRLMDLERKFGIRSTFYIVPERYPISEDMIKEIKKRGFGCGVHGLHHDGKLFSNYQTFLSRAARINEYLHFWGSKGFSAPSMIRRLEWMHHLDIEYSTSTFDTDPFEPQPVPGDTIFPHIIRNESAKKSFVELPYTLPQDFTLFILLREKTIDIWKKKVDWIAKQKGMALINTHPDYMNFNSDGSFRGEEYPVKLYCDFITYIKTAYAGRYWNALTCDVACYVNSFCNKNSRCDYEPEHNESHRTTIDATATSAPGEAETAYAAGGESGRSG